MSEPDDLVAVVRAAWLTLAFMMLLSRVVFQLRGPEGMRAFLDAWQAGPVKRAWGAAALAFALFVAIGLARVADELTTTELLLAGALLAVLVADGLVNVTPAGFRTFKDRMQEAWVARHRGTGREGDRQLFGTVNALLALGSAAMVALVVLYAPIATGTVVVAAVLAVVLSAVLIGANR